MEKSAISIVLFLVIGLVSVATTNDVGEVTFPSSGSEEAQPAFLRGLALLHSFEYEDAAEQFRKAQAQDPNFAMAFWGETMTFNHPIWMEQDRNAALAVLKRLGPTPEARLVKAGTEREKDYLRAVEILYGEGKKQDRDFAYADEMAQLHKKYPDDAEASAFYALSLLGTAHEGRDFAIYMRSAAVLEEVFRDHPQHPGTVHYLIHSYDDPIHAPLGLRPARVYSKIAPSAAHAQHMTSHIFLALGMWDEVVYANENAVRVVNARRKETGKPPSACGHYNSWLLYGYLQQGRTERAKALLAGCREAAAGSTLETHQHGIQMLDPDNSVLGSFVQMWARFILDTEDWEDEIAGWKIPFTEELNPQITYHWMAGLRAIRRGEVEKAEKELETLHDLRTKLNLYYIENKEADRSYLQRAEILEMQLRGMLLIAAEKATEGIDLLQQTALTEESLPMAFGPPFIDKPTRELLGEELLDLHRPKEAIAAFEAALERAPDRTASLRGLAKAELVSGNKEQAAEIQAKLRKIWKNADGMPQDLP